MRSGKIREACFDLVACLADNFEIANDRILHQLIMKKRGDAGLSRIAIDALDRYQDML
jgi:hypothetical protein